MQLIRVFSLTLFVSLFSATVFAHHSLEARQWFSDNVYSDLLQVQQGEIAGRTSGEIKRMNDASFSMLNHFEPRQSQTRVNSISLDYAEKVLASINLHPVVSDYRVYDYKNGLEIGFCFGRATYVHLALLRAGVNKESIKKIWAVGPMQTDGINWQFHVATIVKGDDGGWFVVDTFVGDIVTPEQWFKKMQGVAKDKSLRFYVSEPSKFSVSLGTYDRVQLGLDLSEDQDWYSHYFKKLMKWMGSKPLEEVGLYDLRKKQSSED